MDINKLNNINNSNIKKSNNTAGSSSSRNNTPGNTAPSSEDKISLGDHTFRNNDELFAKLELRKLNEASSKQFNQIKSQVSEYKEAAKKSSKAASKTELGQKLNDPSVWGDIANKLLK